MAYLTLLLLIAVTSYAALENFDEVVLSDAIFTQTRLDGVNSPASFPKAKATMNSPLVVKVNVTQAYSSRLPSGWSATTSLPSQSALDRGVTPPQNISSPIIDGQTRFTSWTVVNKSNWDNLAYQWLYGGQNPRYSTTTDVDLTVLGQRYTALFEASFNLTMEATAVAARAARRKFSLGRGNVIVADFNMWFGDCPPDYSANPTFVPVQNLLMGDTVRNIMREGMADQYCTFAASKRRYFESTLYSPWMTAVGSDVEVIIRFDSDWFVAVEDSDGTRSCCGPSEAMDSALKPVAYEERGKVMMEVETASGTTAVLNAPLRTWRPIPYADRDKLQPPRNEDVTLVWSNPQRLSLKRVRVLWVVEKGYNQGFWALDNINITVVGPDPNSTPAPTTAPTTSAEAKTASSTSTSRISTGSIFGRAESTALPADVEGSDPPSVTSNPILLATLGLVGIIIIAMMVLLVLRKHHRDSGRATGVEGNVASPGRLKPVTGRRGPPGDTRTMMVNPAWQVQAYDQPALRTLRSNIATGARRSATDDNHRNDILPRGRASAGSSSVQREAWSPGGKVSGAYGSPQLHVSQA
eukprot:TRINITY_DN12552_c0_g2_i1.p1 TRINITY_DN12552_c0_g2~~TRINITY_DN12552_c0_g2_i1.p1  ORF type:complete len:581 (+),score=68.36 TRINITY_DN12552_c0_g2_i1:725-2467(+)